MKKFHNFFAIITIIIGIALIFHHPFNVKASDEPFLLSLQKSVNVQSGEDATLKFSIIHEYINERIDITVYNDQNQAVSSTSKNFYNGYGSPMMENFTITLKTKDLPLGSYQVKCLPMFYSYLRWNEAPTPTVVPMQVLKLAPIAASDSKGAMYRMYNPNSGEHFYTASLGEANRLKNVGWKYEGIGWKAPEKSNTPVYRLYNPNVGDHHYTLNASEKNSLVAVGWKYEGIGWYSDDKKSVPLYRQYNPHAITGSHNYTTNKTENDKLVHLGWRAEGIGWYGIK